MNSTILSLTEFQIACEIVRISLQKNTFTKRSILTLFPILFKKEK